MLTLFQIIPTVNIHHRKLKQMPSHRLRLNKVNSWYLQTAVTWTTKH